MLQLERSSGVKFGGASSSHNQQGQHQVSTSNGSGMSFSPLNYQNFQDLDSHDHEMSGSSHRGRSVLKKLSEQEPMLAARVIIEDGYYLVQEVVDIDRFLQFNRVEDGGVQLRQRRLVLLNYLAALIQNDELVFRCLVYLSKGRKLLELYLQLLTPGDELAEGPAKGI